MNYNTELFPFKRNWITIGDHKIHYVDEGSGQIILFSHAPLGSSFMYRRFIQILSRKYRCIAIDYPGFGLSEDVVSQSYSILTQKTVLEEFIFRLELSDIVAFGHDTGGPSIFKVAAENPNLFSGLILSDTIIYPTKEYAKIHTMLGIVGSRLFQFINAQTNFLVRLTFNFAVVTRKLRSEEKKQYYDLFSTPHRRRRITEVLYSLKQHQRFMSDLRHGFESYLVDKPTLLIYGENDPVTKLGIPGRIHAMSLNSDLYLIKKKHGFF